MVKKKIEKPKREVTKRQLSRWQQQKRRQRIIFGLGIFIIVAALGVVGAGWYINQYKPLHQIVITVNDTEFNMNYYVKMLKLMQYPADEVVRAIQQNELIRQEAMKLGISVSNDEVNEKRKSYDPPLSKDYRDVVRAEVLISKLQDEYFEQKVPMFDEQRHIMTMFLESESQTNEVRTKLESGDDFAELVGELSLDGFSETKEGDLGWHPKTVLTTLLGTPIVSEYAFSSEAGVLSQPIYDEAKFKGVGYWLIKVLERNEETEEVHAQVILLGSDEEAQDIRARLEAGEDFATLAKEFSQLAGAKENEGDLSSLSRAMMTPAVDEFVFNPELELGTLSEPIRDETMFTEGGYWLVKVVDIDNNRQIEDDDRDLLKAKALDEWVSALWDNPENKVESFLDDEQKEWAIQQVIRG